PGVVLENGEAEVARPELFPDILRGPLDEGLEKGFYLLFPAVFVLILHRSGEDLVLAVLRPGLGQAFELDIGRSGAESGSSSGFKNLWIAVVSLNDLHLFQGKGQNAVPADAQQLLIRHFEIDLPDLSLDLDLHFRDISRESALCGELVCRKHRIALDEGVAEQAGGYLFDLVLRQGAGDQVLDRIVDPFRRGAFPAGQVFDRFPGRPAGIVRDAGPETDLDGKVEIPRKRGIHAEGLDDRIAERSRCGPGQLLIREAGIDRVDIETSYSRHREMEDMSDLVFD